MFFSLRLDQRFPKQVRTERGVRQGSGFCDDELLGWMVWRHRKNHLIAVTEKEMVELFRRVKHESNTFDLKINKNNIEIVILLRFNTLQLT